MGKEAISLVMIILNYWISLNLDEMIFARFSSLSCPSVSLLPSEEIAKTGPTMEPMFQFAFLLATYPPGIFLCLVTWTINVGTR